MLIAYFNLDDFKKTMGMGTVVSQNKHGANVAIWKKNSMDAWDFTTEMKSVPRDQILACGLYLNSQKKLPKSDQEKIEEALAAFDVQQSHPEDNIDEIFPC